MYVAMNICYRCRL